MLHGSVSSQPDVVARFEREAQAAALVGSEHICEVLDLGDAARPDPLHGDGVPRGRDPERPHQQSGRLTPAAEHPHPRSRSSTRSAPRTPPGIIHRDLKPDNVFILPQKGGMPNFVKILDFGVSQVLAARRRGDERDARRRRRGHALLHVAGAGARQLGHRPAHRHLRDRRPPLPGDHRAGALPGRDLQRAALQDRARGGAPAADLRPRPRSRVRRHHPARHGPRARSALPELPAVPRGARPVPERPRRTRSPPSSSPAATDPLPSAPR